MAHSKYNIFERRVIGFTTPRPKILEILNKPLLHNPLPLAQCNIHLLLLQIDDKWSL